MNQRPFAVFDIDGTLIRWQLYHAIVDALVKLGFIDAAQFRAIRAARMDWKRRAHAEAFKAYQQRLVRLYEQALASLTTAQVAEATTAVFNEYKDQIYTFTRDLIAQLKQQDYLLFAISGSQIEIVEKIARHYGFDDWVGTVYEQIDGHFTGRATTHLGGKHLILAELVAKHGASATGSLAVGDSATDISMLETVEQPIAFNPEKELFEHARRSDWKIVVERKNVVYKLEANNGSYLLA